MKNFALLFLALIGGGSISFFHPGQTALTESIAEQASKSTQTSTITADSTVTPTEPFPTITPSPRPPEIIIHIPELAKGFWDFLKEIMGWVVAISVALLTIILQERQRRLQTRENQRRIVGGELNQWALEGYYLARQLLDSDYSEQNTALHDRYGNWNMLDPHVRFRSEQLDDSRELTNRVAAFHHEVHNLYSMYLQLNTEYKDKIPLFLVVINTYGELMRGINRFM